MSQSINSDLNAQAVQIDVFDPVTGHVDAVATAQAAKEVFTEANIVRLPSGEINHAATLTKRVAAKFVVSGETFLSNDQYSQHGGLAISGAAI